MVAQRIRYNVTYVRCCLVCGLSSTHVSYGVCFELMCIFYMYRLYPMMTSRVRLFKGYYHERLLRDVTLLQLRLVSTWPRTGRTRRRCISHSLRIGRRRHFESVEIGKTHLYMCLYMYMYIYNLVRAATFFCSQNCMLISHHHYTINSAMQKLKTEVTACSF